MPSPDDLKYTDSHEWLRLTGNIVTLGITRFAVDELTDITFLDLPEKGDKISPDEPLGEIESVKATSEIYSPVSGTITEVNMKVIDNPEIINSDPFGNGWLIKLEVADTTALDQLMDYETYDDKYPT